MLLNLLVCNICCLVRLFVVNSALHCTAVCCVVCTEVLVGYLLSRSINRETSHKEGTLNLPRLESALVLD